MEALKWGLRVLVLNCPHMPTIVVILQRKVPLRAGKKQHKNNLFVAQNGPFGTPFLTPKFRPKRFMWFPLGNEEHNFCGGPKWGVLGGGQKVYVERVMCFFRPLIICHGIAYETICEHKTFQGFLKGGFLRRGGNLNDWGCARTGCNN